jgi:hypothetical protein
MELSNLFKLMTKSGHPSLDAVKSAIQKYARRGMHTEMLQAVSEMDAFKAYDAVDNVTTQRAAKAIRTNMINRLKAILFEDVSFSQVGAFTTICEKIKEWEDDGRTDEKTLAEIVANISHAKKLRLPSYLRASYGKGEACDLDKKGFLEGIDNKDIKCVEWIYHNDKEALKMLEDRQFPGKDHILPIITTEWKRFKPTKSKAGSNERFIFVVVPWLWIMYDEDLIEQDGADAPSFNEKEIVAAYNKVNVKFEDYVYDNHTKEGKKKGKTAEDFRAEGAVVTNEDDVWLSQFEDLKDYYNNQPEETKPKKPRTPRKLTEEQKAKRAVKEEATPKRLRRGAVKPDNIKEIELDVNEIELITEGVCSGKLPCGYVTIKGGDKVIKPMTKGLNYGMDYCYMDKQKHLFGLKDLDIKIRKIPGKALTVKCTEIHVGETKLGKTKLGKTKLGKHRSYEWEDNNNGQVIVIMNKINVKTDLGKCKELLKDEVKFREMLKIRLFNGLFRTSDNTTSNILVDEDDELWAIDENDIYGVRKEVFNKKEPVRNSDLMTAELIESVIDELDFATHEQTLIDEMPKYFPKASCEFYERELRERIRNYKQIVLKELKLNEPTQDDVVQDDE